MASKEKDNRYMPVLIISGAVISVFMAIYIFVLPIGCGHESGFSILGNFGSFYGGVLGTIITFVGLYFIYKTYMSQQEQLKNAKKDSDLQIIEGMIRQIIEDINSISFNGKKGIDALYEFNKEHWKKPNSVMNHLGSLIISFKNVIEMVGNRVLFKYGVQEDMTLTRIYFLYYSKILWPAYGIYNQLSDELKENHADSPAIFKGYEDLAVESFNYLYKKELVEIPKNSKKIKDLLIKHKIIPDDQL